MAGGIKKSYALSDIPIVGDFEADERKISLCPDCQSVGFRSVLGPRIYKKDEPLPPDYDSWRQCHRCGLILPIYETKKESKIKDTIETTNNPFEGTSKIEPLRDNRTKKTSIQREHERLLKGIDQVKDDDIKRELRRGAIVNIIEDSMNY